MLTLINTAEELSHCVLRTCFDYGAAAKPCSLMILLLVRTPQEQHSRGRMRQYEVLQRISCCKGRVKKTVLVRAVTLWHKCEVVRSTWIVFHCQHSNSHGQR